MKKIYSLTTLFIILFASSISGQYVVLDQQFKDYTVVHIESALHVNKIEHSRSDIVNTNILGYDLQLFSSNIISPNYKIRVKDEAGSRFVPTKLPKPMQGTTRNGGKVSLTFNDDFIYGFINDGDDMIYIEPLSHFEQGKPKDLYVVYNVKDIVDDGPKTCGVTEMEEKYRDASQQAQNHKRSVGQCYEVEWAIANDWLMFQSYGSIGAVENHAIGVVNDVQTNYDNEFEDEIQFFVSEQFVSSCSTCDPWTSNTNAGTLLSSFRNWGPGGFSFSHDIGSLWTDRNFNGSTIGIAYVGVVCTGSRYNCLQDWSSNANLKRVMVAHEVGHNFDSGHDASGSPFIMAPSVQSTTQWSTNSFNVISDHIASRWCLSTCTNSTAPVADFDLTYIDQCVPGQVDFNDLSTGTVTAWEWDFPGGTPSTSTQQFPSVTYNQSGVYDVTLTVYNGGLSNSLTLTQFVEILDYPIALFDYLDNGSTVEFTNLSQNGTNYFWDFGDGNSSNEFAPTHTYAEDGTYFVNLVVVNSCGNDFYNFSIVIATPPTSDFSASPTSGCNPQVINFTNNASSNTVSYFWEFEGGSPSTSTDQNPAVLYADAGIYDVKLTVTNPQGSDVKEIVDYITINQSPEPSFTFTSSGNDVNFMNTSIGANDYLWDFGDGSTSTDVNPIHTYPTSGDYIVTLQANSTTCPSATFVDTLTISLEPQAIISVVGGDTEGCSEFQVAFMDGSTNDPTSWLWTFEGGIPESSTDQNPVVNFPNVGTFDVSLIATNALGADTLILTDYIVVNTIPTADFDFTKTETIVTFEDNSVDANTYLWEFGDGATSTTANPVHDYGVEGTWEVKLTTTNECGSFSKTQSIQTVLAPIAGFNFDNTPICPEGTVSFMDDSQNTVSSRMWTFTGGTPASSTDANPNVTYVDPGTYPVTLSVTNSEGTDEVTINGAVTVLALPQAIVSVNTMGNVINYEYTGNPDDDVLWTLPDGTNSTDQSVIFTTTENGDFNASIVVTNQCGTVEDQFTSSINVFPQAEISITENNGCADFMTMLSAPDFPDAVYNWTIEGGNPATSTDQNPTVIFNSKGTFDVTLTISNPFGMDAQTLTDAIIVEELPVTAFTAAYDGAFLTTTNQSQNATEYLWDFGDGNSSTEATPTYQYQTNGTYDVTLISTNSCGADTMTQQIEVEILVPAINFSTSVNNGCAPLEVAFTDLSGNDPTTFDWTFIGGNPASSTEQNPTVTYEEEGTYSVSVTMTNAAGTSTLTLTDIIFVLDVPEPSFSFTNTDGVLDFTDESNGLIDSYEWDFGDGTTSNEQNPSHTYDASGTYTITLTTSNSCGSTTTTQDVVITISSTDEIDFIQDLKIFPNPFNDKLNIEIEFESIVSGQIIVYSNLGQIIQSKPFSNTKNLKKNLDLNALTSGLYLVKIQSGNDFILKKIIKN